MAPLGSAGGVKVSLAPLSSITAEADARNAERRSGDPVRPVRIGRAAVEDGFESVTARARPVGRAVTVADHGGARDLADRGLAGVDGDSAVQGHLVVVVSDRGAARLLGRRSECQPHPAVDERRGLEVWRSRIRRCRAGRCRGSQQPREGQRTRQNRYDTLAARARTKSRPSNPPASCPPLWLARRPPDAHRPSHSLSPYHPVLAS